MALVALPNAIPFFATIGNIAGSPALGTSSTLDAAGEYDCIVYCAREAMTISHVGVRIGVVAGAPTMDVRIETVDPATGFPTGTLWAANTNIVSGTLVSNTWVLSALTASASIAAGQMFAVKFVYNSGTSLITQLITNYGELNLNCPYFVTNTSGAAAKSRRAAVSSMALGSDATTFYRLPTTIPVSAVTSSAFSNSAGGRRGLRFQVPCPVRCCGLMWWNTTSVGDFNATIYNDAGTELSSSNTAFEGDISANSNIPSMQVFFDNPVELAIGTWYRIVVEPSSATNITVAFLTLPSSSYRSATPWGANAHYTTYTTAGGWIDTATDQEPLMDILVDKLDNGAGGGGAKFWIFGPKV